jgi:hypothetical protein
MRSEIEKNSQVRKEGFPKKLGSTYLKIGAITFVLGSIFILVGLYIDSISGRYPVFTIMLIAISFPLILFINYRIVVNAIEKLHQ